MLVFLAPLMTVSLAIVAIAARLAQWDLMENMYCPTGKHALSIHTIIKRRTMSLILQIAQSIVN